MFLLLQKLCLQGPGFKSLANLAGSRGRSENSSNLERGLHPSFPDPANSYKVSNCCKPLCQSPQEQLPVGGITSAYRQKCSGTGPQSNISGFLQSTISSPKAQQQMEANTGPKQPKLFLKVEKFKMETPETIRTSLQQGEWVTSVDFKDDYFHIPIQEQSRKYLRFLVQGRTYQFKALPFGLSTAPMEFTVLAKEVKLMAIHRGIRIHQYLDDWLVRARSQHICLQHTQILVKRCQDLGSPCKRIIMIAPGWPNMPWFWDLVTMSSQAPLSLPNLPNVLTQPFNQIPHRNLTNLNLHAWLLEPQKKNRASLRQWQQELRLLKEDLPDQSMRQSGPFLQSGASLIRWTSGHHL